MPHFHLYLIVRIDGVGGSRALIGSCAIVTLNPVSQCDAFAHMTRCPMLLAAARNAVGHAEIVHM